MSKGEYGEGQGFEVGESEEVGFDLEEITRVEVVRWVKGSDIGGKPARCARQKTGR